MTTPPPTNPHQADPNPAGPDPANASTERAAHLAALRHKILLDLDEVADLTGVSTRVLLEMCKAGGFPRYRIGERYRLTPDQIPALLAAHLLAPNQTYRRKTKPAGVDANDPTTQAQQEAALATLRASRAARINRRKPAA